MLSLFLDALYNVLIMDMSNIIQIMKYNTNMNNIIQIIILHILSYFNILIILLM